MDTSESKRLKHVAKLIKQFRSNIKYKPFNSSIDQARVIGFLNSLSDVLMGSGRGLSQPRKETKMFESEALTEEEMEKNKDLSAEWLKRIRNRND